MITDIPTPSEFHAAGLNHLDLAWNITIRSILDWREHQDDYDDGTVSVDELRRTFLSYWTKSQPAMANSLALLLQAMEMALKGRIAAISPFLLISRNPKEWPVGEDGKSVPFGEFRTIDASDLMEVHNAVSSVPLSSRFITFWNRIRVERNTLMHTANHAFIEPAYLVRSILTAVQALFSEKSWPKHIRAMLDANRYSALGLDDSNLNYVMRQVEAVIEYLEPAEAKLFLGFDKSRRSYVCPACYQQASRDWPDVWPKLAQLRSRSSSETSLVCVVCEEISLIERTPCVRENCPGNVIKEGVCLTCMTAQDDPTIRNSHSTRMDENGRHLYHFTYVRGARTSPTMSISLATRLL